MLARTRRLLRRTVPEPLRAGLALLRRTAGDRARGTHHRFAALAAAPAQGQADWHPVVTIRQDIRQSAWWQGKLANLTLGAARLDGLVIAPGQLFSFWQLVGRPSAAAGFELGRGIRADAAGGDIGGGLCQLSGIAYELGLRGGLQVAERHAHSRDLYAHEVDRFCPLGLDATVVWPWKDLRAANPHDCPVQLRFAVHGLELTATLLAAAPLRAADLVLERHDGADDRCVTVWRGPELISRDCYVIDRGD